VLDLLNFELCTLPCGMYSLSEALEVVHVCLCVPCLSVPSLYVCVLQVKSAGNRKVARAATIARPLPPTPLDSGTSHTSSLQ